MSVCFAAEDLPNSPTKKDSPKSESIQQAPIYANEPTTPETPTKTETTPPPSPAVIPTTPVTPNPKELNGVTTPDSGKASTPEPSVAPQAANEKAINNAPNSKNVEELYDIPVGEYIL